MIFRVKLKCVGIQTKTQALEFLQELEEFVWDILSSRNYIYEQLNEKQYFILEFRINQTFPKEELEQIADKFGLTFLGFYENLDEDIVETIFI